MIVSLNAQAVQLPVKERQIFELQSNMEEKTTQLFALQKNIMRMNDENDKKDRKIFELSDTISLLQSKLEYHMNEISVHIAQLIEKDSHISELYERLANSPTKDEVERLNQSVELMEKRFHIILTYL